MTVVVIFRQDNGDTGTVVLSSVISIETVSQIEYGQSIEAFHICTKNKIDRTFDKKCLLKMDIYPFDKLSF